MSWSSIAVACVFLSVTLVPAGPLQAQRAHTLTNLSAFQAACRRAALPGVRELYTVDVQSADWRLGPDREAGFVAVDTSRNLPLFNHHAEVFARGLESLGFAASGERAIAIRNAARAGAVLRIGFFLGFDEPDGTPCLVRPAAGVTVARIDLAFVELLDRTGELVAREGHDRFRAWADNVERERVPGCGPRGVVAAPVNASSVPQVWRRALQRSNETELAATLATCHAAGVQAGAEESGRVVVRLLVAGGTGRITANEVEFSSIANRVDAQCIAEAFSRVRLPAAAGARAEHVVRVPIRLAADRATCPASSPPSE